MIETIHLLRLLHHQRIASASPTESQSSIALSSSFSRSWVKKVVGEAGRSCQIHQLRSSSSSVCGWLAVAWISSSARQKSQTAWEVGGNRMEVLGTIIVIDSLTLRVPINSIDIVIVGSNMATMAMQWLLCRISYCDLQLPERYKTSWQTTGTKRIELWWSYDGAFRRRS